MVGGGTMFIMLDVEHCGRSAMLIMLCVEHGGRGCNVLEVRRIVGGAAPRGHLSADRRTLLDLRGTFVQTCSSFIISLKVKKNYTFYIADFPIWSLNIRKPYVSCIAEMMSANRFKDGTDFFFT